MTSWWIALVLLALVVPLFVGLRRINELFVVRARRGRLELVRGRIPRRLLGDLDDVMRSAPEAEVELRAVIEDGRAVIHTRPEIAPPLRQRLRNTISLWPVAKIRNAPRR